MKLGYIGLGKMGKNMVERLLTKKHEVVVWNRSSEVAKDMQKLGAKAAESIEELVSALPSPRIIWLMLPAGEPTQTMLTKLSELLAPGDTIINGANEYYKNTLKHYTLAKAKNIHFIDVGVSGGPGGAKQGACLMIGGSQKTFEKFESLFADIAAPNAYQFFAGHGAGHFVKMVHNGIEYGMMQAIGEGFEVLKKSEFNLDLEKVARIYNHRSVIESRLVGWLHQALLDHGDDLEGISGEVSHSGEGQWTVETAKELMVSVPIIEGSLDFRIQSTGNPSFTGQVVSALRHQFGGHDVTHRHLR
jgi:6-phosphogluconate dehydrogenase